MIVMYSSRPSLHAPPQSQSIVITGESGAGKTYVTQKMLDFIAYVSISPRSLPARCTPYASPLHRPLASSSPRCPLYPMDCGYAAGWTQSSPDCGSQAGGDPDLTAQERKQQKQITSTMLATMPILEVRPTTATSLPATSHLAASLPAALVPAACVNSCIPFATCPSASMFPHPVSSYSSASLCVPPPSSIAPQSSLTGLGECEHAA